MYQEFYANSHLLILPIIALGLFVAAFIAILYWVFVQLRHSSMPEYMAHLPLSDGSVVDVSPEDSTDE
ncbi:MAG: CcoQ/FixQ family Cbb3-type cytochrome c oxidase assembly chaperone [Acidobacteriota bacterium]|nr:CcoQ/FixQ family Cbb3-type cytochrome c oxidase assembly chaperone [Acidobacteriota bacterium]